MKKLLLLLILTLFFVAIGCDDNGVTPVQSKCIKECEEWQDCNENTATCVIKDERCEKDESCSAETPICNLTDHICVAADKCNPNPCEDEHKTRCGLTEGGAGFECSCDDGYKLDGDKCILDESSCNPNPCQDEHKTKCELVDGGDNPYVCNCDEGYKLDGDKCILDETSPCNPNPCQDENKTKCEIMIGGDNPYVCNCDDGFILDGDKCIPPTCDTECTEDVCDGDNIKRCVLNTATGCKELVEAESCGDHMTCDTNACVCADTCVDSTPSSCIGENLVQCLADTNGCFYLDTKVCDSGCDDNGDTPFCTCEECIPEDFNSSCNDYNLGYTYCEDLNGCFSIKTVDCESGSHCDATAELTCVANDCTNECSDGDIECKESGTASILVNCEIGEDGCFHKVDGPNCTLLNMTCSNELNLCLGDNGLDTCTDGEADILSSGLWYGTTKNMTNDYQGCRRQDNFNGLDTVYKIELTTENSLNVKVKERGEGALGSIVPSIYIRKVCNGMDDQCKRATANNSGEANLNFTATENGLYYIIIDRKKGSFDITSGYDFEMLIDLQ